MEPSMTSTDPAGHPAVRVAGVNKIFNQGKPGQVDALVDIDLTVPLPGHFEAALPLVGVVSGVEFDADATEGVVVQVRYARARPSHRVGLALQLAALQLQYPVVKWSAVLAQRLVRLLCPDCKQPYRPSEEELRRLGLATDRELTLYKEQGCEKCLGTGYRGRTGVYELMVVDGAVVVPVRARATPAPATRPSIAETFDATMAAAACTCPQSATSARIPVKPA